MGAKTSSNFTRPNDTTAYAAGDLVANSTTAGSVTALSWTYGFAGSLRRVILRTSNATITNGTFDLWLFSANPSGAPTNGDNGALAGLSFTTYPVLAVVPLVLTSSMGSVGGRGHATYDHNLIEFGAGTIYGLLEARAAYTPAANEVFTVELELAP